MSSSDLSFAVLAGGACFAAGWFVSWAARDVDWRLAGFPLTGMLARKPTTLSALLVRAREKGVFIGLDIGGTLTKLIVQQAPGDEATPPEVDRVVRFLTSQTTYGRTGHRDERLEVRTDKGTLHLVNFATRRMYGAFALARGVVSASSGGAGGSSNLLHIPCTGGGARKYAGEFGARLPVSISQHDELGCLVSGLVAMLRESEDECFAIDKDATATRTVDMRGADAFPLLLVNVGSGVSLVHIEGPQSWKRVSGTSIGGGTFFGLCNMITGLTKFGDMLQAAADGDHTHVDLTVGDIYGMQGGVYGLKSSDIAANFGKALAISRLPGEMEETGATAGSGGQATSPPTAAPASSAPDDAQGLAPSLAAAASAAAAASLMRAKTTGAGPPSESDRAQPAVQAVRSAPADTPLRDLPATGRGPAVEEMEASGSLSPPAAPLYAGLSAWDVEDATPGTPPSAQTDEAAAFSFAPPGSAARLQRMPINGHEASVHEAFGDGAGGPTSRTRTSWAEWVPAAEAQQARGHLEPESSGALVSPTSGAGAVLTQDGVGRTAGLGASSRGGALAAPGSDAAPGAAAVPSPHGHRQQRHNSPASHGGGQSFFAGGSPAAGELHAAVPDASAEDEGVAASSKWGRRVRAQTQHRSRLRLVAARSRSLSLDEEAARPAWQSNIGDASAPFDPAVSDSGLLRTTDTRGAFGVPASNAAPDAQDTGPVTRRTGDSSHRKASRRGAEVPLSPAASAAGARQPHGVAGSAGSGSPARSASEKADGRWGPSTAENDEVLGEFWEDGRFRARPEDVCKAALLMVTNQIGQVSLLTAQRLGVRKVLFAGNFLRHNEGSSEAQRRLSWALRYWSGGRTEALFLRREGYYGALGALLLGATARSPSE